MAQSVELACLRPRLEAQPEFWAELRAAQLLLPEDVRAA